MDEGRERSKDRWWADFALALNASGSQETTPEGCVLVIYGKEDAAPTFYSC